MKAFISYSHKDHAYLERLHAHLAVLRREGDINAWYDREILAGTELDSEIIANLESAGLCLILVSPDFLASNYCYEKEMQKAITQHESGKIRIVPIILEPCDWQSTPLKKFKAVPRDGVPVAEWKNQNNAFLDIVMELRRIVENCGEKKKPNSINITSDVSKDAKRQYRVKRDFDKVDRTDFRDQAFKEIRNFIHSSIAEIDGIENIRARFTDITAYSFTCLVVNRSKERGEGAITVHSGGGNRGMMGDIYYSFSENAAPNTSNGGFSIESDDYELYLRHSFSMRSEKEGRFTAVQAANVVWSDLLERVGIVYA